MKSTMLQRRQAKPPHSAVLPCSPQTKSLRQPHKHLRVQLRSVQTDNSTSTSSPPTVPPSAASAPQPSDNSSKTINALDSLLGTPLTPPPPPPKPAAAQAPSAPRVEAPKPAVRSPAAQSQRDTGRPDKADESFTGIMGFSGLAPEVINARCAMIAFVAALGSELGNGQSIYVQLLGGGGLRALAVIAFVLVASFAPKLNKDTTWTSIFAKNKNPPVFGPFDANAELINGRAAMLGLATILFIEGTSSYAFFS